MITSSVQLLRQRAEGIWTQHQAALLALCLTVLAAVLRLYHATASGLRLDEVYSVWIARRSIPEVLQAILVQGADASPPTYYVLLHLSMLFGESLPLIRAVSIIASIVTVWLTFRLAAYLFDLRIAALSAFLLAIAPLQIEYAQVARAYALMTMWGIASIYLFARLLFEHLLTPQTHPATTRAPAFPLRLWAGLLATTAAAFYTHYQALLIILLQNSLIGLLWLAQRVTTRTLLRWLLSQVALAILLLPLGVSLVDAAPGTGQRWLAQPGVLSLVKSVILFGTGDPSYGAAGFTASRLLSLATIGAIAGLAIWMVLRRTYHRIPADEVQRVMLLVYAAAMPLLTALGISQMRNLYKEKYMLFVAPPLLILFAWVIWRIRWQAVSLWLALMLIGLTGSALGVYYTEPSGEQWREAIGSVRQGYQPGDVVIVAPGFYIRPFVYYFYGDFPPALRSIEFARSLTRAPAAMDEQGTWRAAQFVQQPGNITASDPDLLTARRIWLVTGYAPPDPVPIAWLEQHFEPMEQHDFLGARVTLLRRAPAQP